VSIAESVRTERDGMEEGMERGWVKVRGIQVSTHTTVSLVLLLWATWPQYSPYFSQPTPSLPPPPTSLPLHPPRGKRTRQRILTPSLSLSSPFPSAEPDNEVKLYDSHIVRHGELHVQFLTSSSDSDSSTHTSSSSSMVGGSHTDAILLRRQVANIS